MKTNKMNLLAACAAFSIVVAGSAVAGSCGSGASSGDTKVMQTAGYGSAGSAAHKASDAKSMDIVQTAISAGSFKTLVAAVQAAGLVETLQGKGPFTVFAPTDEAFAKLPKGTVEDLLKPENKQKLVSILTYHVVPGAVKAADVVKLSSARTVQGQNVEIKTNDGKVMVNNASVVKTDIDASNGVIHVIDTVIIPS